MYEISNFLEKFQANWSGINNDYENTHIQGNLFRRSYEIFLRRRRAQATFNYAMFFANGGKTRVYREAAVSRGEDRKKYRIIKHPCNKAACNNGQATYFKKLICRRTNCLVSHRRGRAIPATWKREKRKERGESLTSVGLSFPSRLSLVGPRKGRNLAGPVEEGRSSGATRKLRFG